MTTRRKIARVDDSSKHTSRKNKLWFPTSSRIQIERVLDVAEIVEEVILRRMPWGFFIHSPSPTSLGQIREEADAEGITPLQLLLDRVNNLVFTCGGLIPTELLDGGWIFNLTHNDPEQLLKEAQAISLLISHFVLDDFDRLDTNIGTGRSIQSLDSKLGNCYERAPLLVAIFRLNGIPARVVGNPDFLPRDVELDLVGDLDPAQVDLPINRGHWWVEVFINNEWHALETSYLPSAIHNLSIDSTPDSDASILGPFLGLGERIRSNQRVGMVVGMIDNPDLLPSVQARIVPEEIDLPRGYPKQSGER